MGHQDVQICIFIKRRLSSQPQKYLKYTMCHICDKNILKNHLMLKF